MNIDIKDLLTLNDGNKYIVCSKTKLDNKTYYYLVDINDNKNLKFCLEDNGDLIELEDKALIQKLLPMFTDEVKDIINSLIEEEN